MKRILPVLKVCLALFALLAVTQAWTYSCERENQWNSLTGIDSDVTDRGPNLGDQQHGEEPPIDHLAVAPDDAVLLEVGETIEFTIVAADAAGNPIPNTEAAVYIGSENPTVVALLAACGGRDRGKNQKRCEAARGGLGLSYHKFENDGRMTAYFKALAEGDATVWFSYPGPIDGIDVCTQEVDNGAECRPPPSATHIVRVDVTVCGPSNPCDEPADADGDGVADAEDDCPNTPPDTDVDGNGCPLAPADADGDGVADADDDCPTTPPDTTVDENGCPEDHPTLAEIAPGDYIFRKLSSQLGCSGTVTQNNDDASTSNVGGLTPLRLQTFFTAPPPSGATTSTVQGPYDPVDGTYIANGTDDFGNVHELDGHWTVETDGDPRFAGTLVERKGSPTCENTFAVTYTVD